MKFVAFFIFCSFFCSSALGYKAAVFEYYPNTELTGRDRILKNLDNYETYVDEIVSQSVNIFVFPEYGLTGLEVDPTEYAVEITEEEEVIARLKNIALSHEVYLVINLLEKVSESNKQTKYYNTNLVFNRDGDIKFKYRKINLYKEPNITPGGADQNLTFNADELGTIFGVFTGRDILFGNPSRRVLEDSTVKDIVYPSLWYSTMPFLTSLSVQRGYADANGVNLLAAGYGKPNEGHGGSGIYLGTGEVVETYIADTASTKPIIQNITLKTRTDKTMCPKMTAYGLPSEVGKSNVTNYKTKLVLDTAGATFFSVDLTQPTFNISRCIGNFCCNFDLRITSSNPQEFYKGMVFDGELDLGDGSTHYQICSLLACTTDSKDSCGDRIDSLTTQFNKIDVSATGFKHADQFGVPVTVDSYLLPIKNTLYCQNGSNTELTTLKSAQNVLAFGLLGKSLSGAAAIHAYGLFFLIVFTFVKSFVF